MHQPLPKVSSPAPDGAASGPLAPGQRGAYAAAIDQAEAIHALEDMAPSKQDKAIDAAILAGNVSPEQARDELLAYVTEHKTLTGFIESRSWAIRR